MRRLVLLFRWVAFLTAGITLLAVFVLSPYLPVGGPFRFFEVWVLMLSFFTMGRMMAIVERRSSREWPAVVAGAAALNVTVIILHAAGLIGVHEARDGLPLPDLLALSLYVIAPALQCIDALFLHANLRSPLRATVLVLVVMGLYLFWTERIIQSVSTRPWGEVTDGLPHGSLNDLTLDERAWLYAGVAALSLLALTAIILLGRVIQKSASGAHD